MHNLDFNLPSAQEQLDIISFVAWNPSRQQNCSFFSVITKKKFKILNYIRRKAIVRQRFCTLMDPHFQGIVVVGIFYISEPLLANAIQKCKRIAADGMSIVHVLLTKSVSFRRFMPTPGNIIRQ